MVRPGRLMVWLVATLSTAGTQADFSHSGYLKNQTAGSRSLVNGDPYLSNLTRLRLKPRYREGDWTIEAAYDLAAHGQLSGFPGVCVAQGGAGPALLDPAR